MSPSSTYSSDVSEFTRGLRDALPYLEEFYQKTFIIKISGNTLQQQNLPSILDDLILLYRVGIKIIIVHGARPQIQEALQFHGHTAVEEQGHLVVTAPLMPVVKQAIATTNWELITRLSRYGRGIFPFSSHFVQAQKHSFGIQTEPHFTGDVHDINTGALQNAFTNHYLPIIPPFAIGKKGRLWILEPNQVALEVAVRLRARKLIILHSADPQIIETSSLRETTTQNMKEWLQNSTDLTMSSQLQAHALIEACEHGVERCHWLNSNIDGALLGEILTSAGTGNMVTNSVYECVRFAELNDVHRIIPILEKPIKDLVLVHKSHAYLEQHIENFLVFCIDEEVAGCCELILFKDSNTAEIGSFAVKEEYRNRGIGKQLIAAAQEHASQKHCTFVFALTTKASHIFKSSGFKECLPDQLPKNKMENYDSHHSIVYGKPLL
ncbi:MAG: amino-acid N-acetyltransferase [SAR324 cluster bacterium]|nr:amino-acid N-acetyltransferase [SAR324 cluster bacterium]